MRESLSGAGAAAPRPRSERSQCEPLDAKKIAPPGRKLDRRARPDGRGDEHLAATRERADTTPCLDRLVRAGERVGPLGAEPERLPGHVQLGRRSIRAPRPAGDAAARIAVAAQSTGRRLSGSTSDRSSSSSPR